VLHCFAISCLKVSHSDYLGDYLGDTRGPGTCHFNVILSLKSIYVFGLGCEYLQFVVSICKYLNIVFGCVVSICSTFLYLLGSDFFVGCEYLQFLYLVVW